ncbi:MAG: EamA family transporter [Parcubacteria group bacterium]
MLWAWIVIASQAFNAGAMLLDKFLLTKKIPSPAVLTFWTCLANLLGVVFVFWNFHFNPGTYLLILSLLSGASFTAGLWFYFLAMKRGEATHIGPMVGGVVPIVSFAMSYLWLGERLTATQNIAVLLLIVGIFIISFEKTAKHSGWHLGMLWAIFAGAFFAVSYVLIHVAYQSETFSTAFVWARVGCMAAALLLLFHAKTRRAIFTMDASQSSLDRSSVLILAVNKVMATLYFLGMNVAVYLASATLVNAFAGLQYVFLFFAMLVSTRFYPKFMKEYFSRWELATEIIALLFIAAGVGVMLI